MTHPLRIGIIGCGVIAPAHIESFQRIDGVEVAVLCDLLPQRSEALARKYGVARTTTRYHEVTDDPSIDAVAVCTDHASHAPIAMAAIGEGKHVICEKALSAHPEALAQMLAAAREHPGRVFAGVFQHRFDPIFRLLRQAVADGTFGTLLTAEARLLCLRTDDYYRSDAWRGTFAGEGGSLLINQAIHFVDILQWITGGVESLSAVVANRAHQGVIETEDSAVIAMQLKCGALGSVVATSSSHIHWEPTVCLTGTDGLIEVRNGTVLRMDFSDPQRTAQVAAAIEGLRENNGVAAARDYYGSSHAAQIADFVHAIRNRGHPFVHFEDAAQGLRVVFAAYAAARSGRAVRP